MANTRLIVLNTLVSYGRSLLSVALTLFSTRWVLEALGKEDFGLYFAVGGVVAFLGFINTSMSLSSQRHLAYAIGHGGTSEVHDWFNASLSLHLLLGLVFLVLSLPAGLLAFRFLLKIPEGRETACRVVYACSVLVAAGSVFSVPYNAMYIARQRIYELTVIQLVQTILVFAFSWLLLFYRGDRLVLYALGMVATNAIVYCAQIMRCRRIFPECRVAVEKMRDGGKCKALLSFSGWSLASTLGFVARGQGVAVLLNNFGTQGANAAYSIANNVSSQTAFMANGFMHAISPEITTSEGAGKREDMVRLATRSSKFALALVLFLVVPLYTDVEALLAVWLKEVPEQTASFVRLMMGSFVSIQSVLGVSVANKAFGKIALPQSLAAAILLASLPVAYGACVLGLPMTWVVATVALSQFLCAVSTLYSAQKLFGYPVFAWVKESLVRNLLIAAVGLLANVCIHRVVNPGLLRFVLVSLVDAVVICGLGWLVLLSADEKSYVSSKLKAMKARMQ